VLSPKELALTNGVTTANGSTPTDTTPATEAVPEERPES
jgi:cell division protease FtsH